MLIEFYGENFRCFRDPFSLSMLAADIDAANPRGVVEVSVNGDSKPLRLLRSATIFGANASGKSTIFSAALTFQDLLARSSSFQSDWLLPYEPYALTSAPSKPVRLGVKGWVDGDVYDYAITFTDKEVQEERLTWLSSSDGPTDLFRRIKHDVTGTWTRGDEFKLLAKAFRGNALLLSLADSLMPSLAQSIAVGLNRAMGYTPPSQPLIRARHGSEYARAAALARDNTFFKQWLLQRLTSADLGIVDIQVKESEQTLEVPEFSVKGGAIEFKTVTHKSTDLVLIHRGDDGIYAIPYQRESLGTQRLINLAPKFFALVKDQASKGPGTSAWIDEIDSSLHPLLLRAVMRFFNFDLPESEVAGQLICSTHENILMDGEIKDNVLRRDQVYLVDKAADGASRIYSVAEFSERNNLNMRKRYLEGRYGALPSL